MRYPGYCPSCGHVSEHVKTRNKKTYYCLQCGCKEDTEILEDIWLTFNLSR